MIPIHSRRKNCPTCDRECIIEAVEWVPGGGILYQCRHEDGSQPHEYSEYENIDAMRTAKTDQPPVVIDCPECHNSGVIRSERDDTDRERPDNWKYYIWHPQGLRRCLVASEHRDLVLKALGRYIEKENP